MARGDMPMYRKIQYVAQLLDMHAPDWWQPLNAAQVDLKREEDHILTRIYGDLRTGSHLVAKFVSPEYWPVFHPSAPSFRWRAEIRSRHHSEQQRQIQEIFDLALLRLDQIWPGWWNAIAVELLGKPGGGILNQLYGSFDTRQQLRDQHIDDTAFVESGPYDRLWIRVVTQRKGVMDV